MLLRDADSERLLRRMREAPFCIVGPPTLLEAAMVLSSRLKHDPVKVLQRFLREGEVEVVPFTQQHYEAAVEAFVRYGKGKHPAALNFGDCMAYAVARVAGMPLLYVGQDFSKTDLG